MMMLTAIGTTAPRNAPIDWGVNSAPMDQPSAAKARNLTPDGNAATTSKPEKFRTATPTIARNQGAVVRE